MVSFLRGRGKEKETEDAEAQSDDKVKKDALKLELDNEKRVFQAYHGDYFRTHLFVNTQSELIGEEYMQAEKQADDSWTLSRVLKNSTGRPLSDEFEKQVERMKERGIDVPDFDTGDTRLEGVIGEEKGLCFLEAMHKMAVYNEFQKENSRNGLLTEREEGLGESYYFDFAHRAKLIFDEHGMPHITRNGRYVDTDVKYPDSELEIMKLWAVFDSDNEQSGDTVEEQETVKLILKNYEKAIAAPEECRHFCTGVVKIDGKNGPVQEYMEAFRTGDGRAWNVRKVRISQRLGDKPQDGQDRKPVKVHEYSDERRVVFMHALLILSQYSRKHAQDISNIPADKTSVLYRDVAHDAQVIFDTAGRPRKTENGRPVDSASFSEEELEVAEQWIVPVEDPKTAAKKKQVETLSVDAGALKDIFNVPVSGDIVPDESAWGAYYMLECRLQDIAALVRNAPRNGAIHGGIDRVGRVGSNTKPIKDDYGYGGVLVPQDIGYDAYRYIKDLERAVFMFRDLHSSLSKLPDSMTQLVFGYELVVNIMAFAWEHRLSRLGYVFRTDCAKQKVGELSLIKNKFCKADIRHLIKNAVGDATGTDNAALEKYSQAVMHYIREDRELTEIKNALVKIGRSIQNNIDVLRKMTDQAAGVTGDAETELDIQPLSIDNLLQPKAVKLG